MVGKDHRSPLVAVAEDLGFYTVQAQLDSGVYIIGAVGQDGIDIFFNAYRLNSAHHKM